MMERWGGGGGMCKCESQPRHTEAHPHCRSGPPTGMRSSASTGVMDSVKSNDNS